MPIFHRLSPLLHRAIQEPVRTILGPNGTYLQAKARTLDPVNKKIICDSIHNDVFEIEYDKLVIAVGVKTNTFGIESIQQGNGIYFLKHLAHARAIRTNIIDSFEKASTPTVTNAERRRLLSFVMVGGGPTSCEFAAELHGTFLCCVCVCSPFLSVMKKVSLIIFQVVELTCCVQIMFSRLCQTRCEANVPRFTSLCKAYTR
jgi:NADH:ubiquinone reductase (non-electrogenic)